MALPQDPMPLKLQGHEAGRMKALFMEFQQETHENIPAPRIPTGNHENIPARGIPTGKPKEHFCSWGPAGSQSPCSPLRRVEG